MADSIRAAFPSVVTRIYVANQVAARLKGDDYQHLFSWGRALELLRPAREVAHVRVEDPLAWSVDDVTVTRTPGSGLADDFFQVKYHVDQRSAYSTDTMVEKNGRTSLLQKFWNTYRSLAVRRADKAVLHLVSNWSWDSRDPFGECISGEDGSIGDNFFAESERSAVGRVREKWARHLGVSGDDLVPFVRALRVRLGHGSAQDLRQQLADAMEFRGLAHDEEALIIATGIVRRWITTSIGPIDRATMDRVLAEHRLVLASGQPSSALVVMNTITSPFLGVAPDYLLDWCSLFEGSAGRRGHQLRDPDGWNTLLLPQLRKVEERIKTQTAARLIRLRGAARLAPWIALGNAFPEVGGYVLEVDQRGARWRTDATPSASFQLVETPAADQTPGGPSDVVAVGLSITDGVGNDVAAFLAANPIAGHVRVFAPRGGPSSSALGSAADASAFAQQAQRLVRDAVRTAGARRVLLFYCGPATGACFLGHWLNSVAGEIVIIEHQQPGYAPTFTFT